MDKAQIAKELTLAIVDKIRPVDVANNASMNESLAKETAKAYRIIYESLNELDKEDTTGPVNVKTF